MQRKYFFLFLLFIPLFTNCSKTNHPNVAKTPSQPTTHNTWKVTVKESYNSEEKINISLENISNKEVLIEFPDVMKTEKQVATKWEEIRLLPYPCNAQIPLRRYEPVEIQQKQVYSWNQKESWCENNTEKTKVVSKGTYRLKVSYAFEEDGLVEEFFVVFEIK